MQTNLFLYGLQMNYGFADIEGELQGATCGTVLETRLSVPGSRDHQVWLSREPKAWPYWKKLCVWHEVAGSLLMEKLQRLPDLQRRKWLKCNLLVGVFVQ